MINKNRFTSSQLKLFAIIFMLIDHFAASSLYKEILFNNGIYIDESSDILYYIFRSIGRLAFPIFAFLIAEGFYYTKNVYKYLTRLFLFAIISEVPFDLAFFGDWLYLDYQNIFLTLFLGLVAILLYDKTRSRTQLSIVFVLVMGILAFLLKTDYSFWGVFLIFTFYYYRGNDKFITIYLIFITIMMSLDNPLQLVAIASLLFILNYNHTKGKNLKYLFYLFYPTHLLILFLLKMII